MAPSLDPPRTLASTDTQTTNPIRRAWNEDRIDIHASLKGRGQENASTTRHALEQRIDSRQKSPIRARTRSRQNSLKRVKNSNEVLRQRSTHKTGNIVKDAAPITPNTREGKPFKVANVGGNGKIYLRPSTKPTKTHQGSVPAQPFNTPETQYPDSDNETFQDREQKYWSASQASITARHPPISSINPRGRRSNSISGRSSILSRNSTSTISPEDALDPGAYRVVIKNGITQTQAVDHQMGSLDINIPHYRLGTPRFSTRGTALITSTIYSRSSAVDDLDIPSRPSADIGRVLPPLSTVRPPFTNPLDAKELPPPPKSVPMRMPITTIAPVFHRAREPIVPAIYESLHSNPDDPAIVRYAMTTREISAASPARIIAQITSKSFLDYELLSDFFLTVRAYLSTNDLLEYLLTRFEWAINRLDDEGRVIRVRSFAAIRHWVLNYFPYDFVVDRDLRVKFCERLNFLAKQVRKKGHEASDLKLIIDLKKCWNGRCALYWDNIGDEIDTRIEHEISPGGIVGSRDSQLTHPNELWAKLASSSQQADQDKSVAALHNWVDSVIEAEVDGKSKGERQGSITGPVHTASFQSEQSTIPATSCVIPSKTMKALAHTGRHQGPHPVPTAVPASARRVCPPAPSAQAHTKENTARPKPDHNRSGSFSDALRDKRTSLGAIQEGKATEPVIMSLPFSGSLVRGSVMGPGSPFIDNHTQHGSGSSMKNGTLSIADRSEKVTEQPMSPGVRNLLANLRRAWSKQQNVAAATASQPNLIPPAPFVMETKHAGLPMHIAHKIEGFGDQHHQLEALKRGARIDLLCADVTDMFERAIPTAAGNASARSSITKADEEEEEEDSGESWQHIPSPRDKVTRNHSEVTTGSRSIVIVDDTSSEPPVPSIPSPYYNHSAHDTTTMPLNIGAYSDPTAYADQSSHVHSGQSSALLPEFSRPHFDEPRPSVTTGRSDRSSNALRKYASYQSGMGRRDDRVSTAPSTLDSEKANMPAGKLLRRRPGGDLKANENVHDMEPRPRRGSTGTIATFRESIQDQDAFKRMPGTKPPSSGTMGRASTPVGRRSISLVSPRQERKDVRRSFERAVAQFARIPDDNQGDLEDTLAKLEGKFRSPKGSSTGGSRSTSEGSALHGAGHPKAPPQPTQPVIATKHIGSQESVLSGPYAKSGGAHSQIPTSAQVASNRSVYTTSEGSYDPVPVADRSAHGQPSQVISAHSNQSNITVPRPLFSPKLPNPSTSSISTGRTSDLGSASRVRRGRCRSSIPTMTTDSFLLDEDESLSDISSDFDSDDDDDDLTEDGETNSVLEDAYGTSAKSMQGPYQQSPAVSAMGSGHLPSPPMTTENAMSISSEARRQQEERKPPTPEPSPVSRVTEASSKSRTPNEVDSCVLQPFANKLHRFPPRRHLPFILSFEPEILAQQFTLIERDALNEINWQDLVDLKWSTVPSTILNWVEYLRFSDPNGIDLVIARANLMVKWAVSEIVLTHHVEERALTIMKLIRIAQAARRQCNYATMLQLTLALTSQDVTRLKKTWACVPERERGVMKEMESLVSPVRNFWNLRHEMDAMEVDGGCVPVVALFLHDLTYNAQKPSVIASTRDSEPLINFERYRTTATIVKSLLRLVDASAKYNYRPVEGALERCLWIASLSDEGIRKRSMEIEAAAT